MALVVAVRSLISLSFINGSISQLFLDFWVLGSGYWALFQDLRIDSCSSCSAYCQYVRVVLVVIVNMVGLLLLGTYNA